MENSLSRSYSSLRFKNEPPNQGCIWGIFHMLHAYHRHNIKKERSKTNRGRRRYDGPKYSRLIENTFDAADGEALIKERTEDLQVRINFLCLNASGIKLRIEENRPSAILSLDESDKTFRENISAEENRHQFPSLHSQFHRLYSIHHLEPSHPHLPDEVREDEENTKIDNRQADCPRISNMSGSDESAASHKRRELNDNPCSMKNLKYEELNELGRELVDESLLQDEVEKSKEASLLHKIFNSKENNKGDTFDKPKEFMNSLDVLNVNHSFLKSLEDPDYSLAHHMQAVRASKGMRGLTKSESYPGSNSSRRMDIEHAELEENGVLAKHEGRVKKGNLRPLSTQPPTFEDNASSIREAETLSSEARETAASSLQGPSDQLKEQGENQAGKKRFKNIRQIIKYAIKESKKSRRISMDAILHKIPYGRSFSKNSKMEINDQWKGCSSDNEGEDSPSAKYENDSPGSTPSKGGQRCMRRAHSLNASLERYSELFKSRIGHDTNCGPSDKLLFSKSPKPLGRMRSLPNIDIHALIQSEAPLLAHFKGTSIMSPSERGTDVERSSFREQKNLVVLMPEALENVTQSDVLLKSESSTFDRVLEESISEINCNENAEVDDTDDAKNEESSYVRQLEEEPEPTTMNGGMKLQQPSPISVLESCFQEDAISPAKFSISGLQLEPRHIDFDSLVKEDANQQDQSIIDSPRDFAFQVGLEKTKSGSMHSASEFRRAQVDRKDEADFNYVRDVLALSRFSKNDYLGAWHSPDQPIDPSLFEQMEACSPPKSSVVEDERSNSIQDQQILFDVVNEVLLEIYNKSFSYWPQRLSCNCHIRPMPKGYHVLEEVWSCIHWYLSTQQELDPSMDYIVERDISKDDGWMNLRFDSECVGLELEEMIWEDLLVEVIHT